MPRTARPIARPHEHRIAGLVALVFAVSSVVGLAHPTPAAAWSAGNFSSASEKELIALTNRSRASAGLKALKVDSTLTSDRPLAQQGHDHARLLQPLHPGLRLGLQEARFEGLLLQGRGREHRLEHEPRRRGHRRHPPDVHGLLRPPSQRARQGLGRHRDRCLQGRRRQEDVDRPVRRQVRLERPEGDPEADAQAEAEGDPPADPQAHPQAEADPQADPDVPPRRRRSRPSSRRRPTTRATVEARASVRAAAESAQGRAATRATAASPATAHRPATRRPG